MKTVADLRTALIILRRDIEACSVSVKSKRHRVARPAVRALFSALDELESAGSALLEENRELRQEVQEQRTRIEALESAVAMMRDELDDMREENRIANDHIQRQIDQLKGHQGRERKNHNIDGN